MAITSDRVREIFKELENGDGTAFFELVADDDVDRTVMGTHLPRSRESSRLDGPVTTPTLWSRKLASYRLNL